VGQRQKTIDFERINMRRWLESLDLPDVPGVAGETARDVLLAIYDVDAGRPCWPGQERIAAMSRVGDRQIRRVLAVLRDRFGLLATFRAQPPDAASRKTLTHYVIVWSEVAVLLNRQPCPVDPVPCPVDPVPCPVDRRADIIYARALRNGTEEENTSSSTCISSATVSTMARSGEEPEEVEEAIAAELRTRGIGNWRSLVECLRRERLLTATLLEEVRDVCRIAFHPANQSRFRSVQGAVVRRLESGVWPVQGVVHDVDGWSTRDHARRTESDEKRWGSAVHSAWLDVRRDTPRGELVEEAAVVQRAVEVYHVPRDFAARERGLADVDFAETVAAGHT
jgi:hypothetical protein